MSRLTGKYKVLVFSRYSRVLGISRLPRALVQGGFEVAALRTKSSYLARTRYVQKHYSCPASSVALLAKLIWVITSWEPDIVIPGDIGSLHFLQRIATSSLVRSVFPRIGELLRFSLGDPMYYSCLSDKWKLYQMALSLGVRVPNSYQIANIEEALRVADELGYPVVLKEDVGSGGAGVCICYNADELVQVCGKMEKRMGMRVAGRRIRGVCNQFIGGLDFEDRGKLQLQQYIEGDPAAFNFVALQGRVLAGNVVYKRNPNPYPTGPCCMVEVFRNDEIVSAASILVSEMGFCGFGAFDFMVEKSTGHAYLIECNPVPTSIAPVGGRLGFDLCAYLFAEINGRQCSLSLEGSVGSVVLLFPHELRRDFESPYLDVYYHDVPVDDPDLLEIICKEYNISDKMLRRARSKYESINSVGQ